MHYFHVVSTAGHDRPVFTEDAMLSDIYAGFAAVVESGVELAAYAIMSAHLHALVGVSDPGVLPGAVKRIVGPAAYSLNRRREQRGAIFRPTFWRAAVLSDAYLWTLPLYIHSNPCPQAGDPARLDVGLRSSHALWLGTRRAAWDCRGEAHRQYGGRYEEVLAEYVAARAEGPVASLEQDCGTEILAVAHVTGVRPATLLSGKRGGREDRLLLAWEVGRRRGASRAGSVLGVTRATATRWARLVADDPAFEQRCRLLGPMR